MKRNVYENYTMTADKRQHKRRRTESSFNRIKEELLSEFPELARFSPEIYEAVIGSRVPTCSRTKEEISGYYQKAIALYKLLKKPRPHHLSHLNGLELSKLEDAGIVRRRLIERIEWSKRISTSRTVVIGHLWKNIVGFATPARSQRLRRAYPSLIPEVCRF